MTVNLLLESLFLVQIKNKKKKIIKGRTIKNNRGGVGGGGGEVKNCRCMNFFMPTCLQDFFSEAQALHGFFFPHISSL